MTLKTCVENLYEIQLGIQYKTHSQKNNGSRMAKDENKEVMGTIDQF